MLLKIQRRLIVIKVSELFEVKYGLNLELNSLEQDFNGINFVSRTKKNNGVSARVKKVANIEPIQSGTISVACGGSVMESFLQTEPFYSGRDLYYLVPLKPLSDVQKLFYCHCLRLNKFRYSYGRQSNSTLKDIMIPSIEEIPSWVNDFSLTDFRQGLLNKISNPITGICKVSEEINLTNLSNIFDCKSGLQSNLVERFQTKESSQFIPYLRPSYRQSTSIDAFVNKSTIDTKYIFPEGTIYVSTDGQGSHTYSYVSAFEFVPNSNITVLLPKREMSLQEKLFYAGCITINRYKFSYGRKPKGDRLKSVKIPKFPLPFLTENIIEETLKGWDT